MRLRRKIMFGCLLPRRLLFAGCLARLFGMKILGIR
jgi:hypothetical protein